MRLFVCNAFDTFNIPKTPLDKFIICPGVIALNLLQTNLTDMKYFLKIVAVLIVITYSLKLVNAQSDLLVFGGLAIIGSAIYFLVADLNQFFSSSKSKL